MRISCPPTVVPLLLRDRHAVERRADCRAASRSTRSGEFVNADSPGLPQSLDGMLRFSRQTKSEEICTACWTERVAGALVPRPEAEQLGLFEKPRH